MSLHRFYPIFDNADWCERLVPLGIKLVQLRAKDLPDDQLRAQIRRSKAVCDAYGCVLVINDFWQMAIEEKCEWVHLGQEDLDAADLGAIRAAGIKLGLSTHDDAELDRALACTPDYVALGPVYPTILKKMKWTEQGLDKVTEWKTKIGDMPLVGIGGLNIERAPGVLDAGADIVSAVTDITLNADPEARVRQWLAVTENHQKQ
ncbi:MAG: thiamine phosphate synthase [Pseudomonadota bacterium]